MGFAYFVVGGPTDTFKPPSQGILFTNDTEIPHGTKAVVLLAHKPITVFDRGKQKTILDPAIF